MNVGVGFDRRGVSPVVGVALVVVLTLLLASMFSVGAVEYSRSLERNEETAGQLQEGNLSRSNCDVESAGNEYERVRVEEVSGGAYAYEYAYNYTYTYEGGSGDASVFGEEAGDCDPDPQPAPEPALDPPTGNPDPDPDPDPEPDGSSC
ncbi:hypothetical protein BRC94_07785 [Halobacteriales archaeon QS_5_70_17]|nr:MAG: hypothetical protein BRC94_07785 [Halobacteriales archaeon QS_5_70_17]